MPLSPALDGTAPSANDFPATQVKNDAPRILFNMKTLLCAILLLALLGLSGTRSQAVSTTSVSHGLEPGEHSVGFRLIERVDPSRTVTGGNSPSKTFPRPIHTYLWYPAKVVDGVRPLLFGRYATLANEDIWPGEIAGSLQGEFEYSRRALARSLSEDALKALLGESMLAIEGAPALEGPFPLIVIGQGLYYESPVAFAAMGEFLAGRGFVVATCPLVGTNSPIVRMNVQDLETAVRDLEFVIAQARQFSFVSADRLGVFGFDMGGMSGLILSMRNADVDAFLSVSSGILYAHPSGIPMTSPDYDPLALTVPWLHSVPASWAKQPTDSKAKSLFETAIHSERYLLLTEGMGHVDYTSYALISGRSAMGGYWAPATLKVIEGHKAISPYISNFFGAFLGQDSESLAFLSQVDRQSSPGSKMTLEHRASAPISITYERFVRVLIAGHAEQAIEEIVALHKTHPDHDLVQEANLERLVWSLRDTWGFTEKVMPVIKLRAVLYPSSNGAQHMLAEGLIAVENFPEAIEVFSRLLQQNPDDNHAQTRLEWLISQ